MPKEVEEKCDSTAIQSFEEDLDDEGCCRCCHCGSGQEDAKSQNYMKMREHLQQRLKAKNNNSNSLCDSSTASRSSSSNCNVDGYAELDYLVKYIEGQQTSTKPGHHKPDPKKAAKRARQKERKLEQKKADALAAKQAAEKPKSSAINVQGTQDRVPNGMVRITHNPLTNSAVITPLYGPLERNPSYLQQPLGMSQPPAPVVVDPPSKPNSFQLSKMDQPTQQQPAITSSQPQQMVTIRRVMQPNLSEPVVTVTLKGETPGNDRVLFTLVNGQVLPTDKAKSNATPPQDSHQSQSAKKKKKKKQKKLLKPVEETPIRLTLNHEIPAREPPVVSASQDFTLDNFRLPPGITLTRVQGAHPPVHHPELPMRMVDRTKKEMSTTTSSPIIVTSPLSAPKPKESLGSLGGLAAPNVIVVDTRKIQQQSQQQPRVVQTCSVAVQTGEDEVSQLSKKQRKKLRKKEKQQQEQDVLEQLAALQLNSRKTNPTKKTTTSTGTTTKVNNPISNVNKPAVIQKAVSTNGTINKTAKTSSKKKKKTRASSQSEDKWEENVFVPKSDIDLEGGDLDEDERELEAFKRFCFNNVPPERKEKVRIHLNVKDIFGKKSQMT